MILGSTYKYFDFSLSGYNFATVTAYWCSLYSMTQTAISASCTPYIISSSPTNIVVGCNASTNMTQAIITVFVIGY